MNDNDLITRSEVELILLEKGQKSKRYKLGEIWELNFDEIREALSEYQPEIVRCKHCIHNGKIEKCVLAAIAAEKDFSLFMLNNHGEWFCADGKR